MTTSEFKALYGNEGKTRKWNPLSGLRKPHNPKKQAPKETPGLLCKEFGKDNPYLGSEEQLQIVTENFLLQFAIFDVCSFHVPNGGERKSKVNSKGKRYSLEGKRMKAQGVKPGVSDRLILKPFEVMGVSFAGMIIELKVSGGVVSENQIKFLNEMYQSGFHVSVCWNGESFEDLIRWAYLNK
jgi:hypothetical protein